MKYKMNSCIVPSLRTNFLSSAVFAASPRKKAMFQVSLV